MTATRTSAIQESAFLPSAIGFWFRRLTPGRPKPELPTAVAVTRHPKLCPSQSSGLRFPFEIKPWSRGRADRPGQPRLSKPLNPAQATASHFCTFAQAAGRFALLHEDSTRCCPYPYPHPYPSVSKPSPPLPPPFILRHRPCRNPPAIRSSSFGRSSSATKTSIAKSTPRRSPTSNSTSWSTSWPTWNGSSRCSPDPTSGSATTSPRASSRPTTRRRCCRSTTLTTKPTSGPSASVFTRPSAARASNSSSNRKSTAWRSRSPSSRVSSCARSPAATAPGATMSRPTSA